MTGLVYEMKDAMGQSLRHDIYSTEERDSDRENMQFTLLTNKRRNPSVIQ